jgi:hypothetical protein
MAVLKRVNIKIQQGCEENRNFTWQGCENTGRKEEKEGRKKGRKEGRKGGREGKSRLVISGCLGLA